MIGADNIDVVRDHYAATNEHDYARAIAHWDEDVVLVVPVGPGYLQSGQFNGRGAVTAWFRDWLSRFDGGGEFDVKEITELDDGEVLLVANYRARGRSSGVPVEGTVMWLYSVRQHKIVRVEGFEARDQALEAVGRAG